MPEEGRPALLKQEGRRVVHEETVRRRRRATKRDGSAPSEGLWPGKPAHAPLRGKSDWKRRPRERGRPARMRSRRVPLSFSATRHPATQPAGTAWARTSQSPGGTVAGRPGWRSWERLCECGAGGTPALPGGLHLIKLSHPWRSIDLRVYSCSFVVRLQQRSVVSLSFDPHRRGGDGRPVKHDCGGGGAGQGAVYNEGRVRAERVALDADHGSGRGGGTDRDRAQ